MSNPKHTLFWMTTFLAVVVVVGILIHKPLVSAFLANWVFNLLILCVLLVGIVITYRQVFVLFPELRWIAQFRTGNAGLSVLQEPRLLKPLARQLNDDAKRDRFSLSTLSLRTVLDGIHSRMDEQREITRYFISLLIFLGLLGSIRDQSFKKFWFSDENKHNLYKLNPLNDCQHHCVQTCHQC